MPSGGVHPISFRRDREDRKDADMAVLLIVFAAVLAWLLASLLTYCLRMGVIGGRAGGDAYRDKQPIRYWIGITGLALAVAFSIGALLFLVANSLLELLGSFAV
jgi:hypothetical protein